MTTSGAGSSSSAAGELRSRKRSSSTSSSSSSVSSSLQQSLSNEALLTSSSSSSDSSNSGLNHNNNLLEDSTGHINRVLAERIFHWEQRLRSDQDLPKVDYSIRSGLRLVEELVQHILGHKGNDNGTSGTTTVDSGGNDNNNNMENNDTLYADLVQEGLVALLDAMQSYRQEEQQQQQQKSQVSSSNNNNNNNNGGGGFAMYAQQKIRKQLESRLNVNLANQPLRLPQSVSKLVQEARRVARQWPSRTSADANDTRPSIAQIAAQLRVPAAQLRDYIHLYKRTQLKPTLSVESTVEITHPLLDDTSVQFTTQDDWEKEQQATTVNNNQGTTTQSSSSSSSSTSLILDDDDASLSSSSPSLHHEDDDATDQWISEYFMDTLLEGDDQAWIVQQEQHAGTLTDLIPDTQEPSPDDQVLSEMIRNDLYKFLSTTLTEQEHQVIRTVFGLDTGRQVSLKAAAAELSLEAQQVLDLLTGGLQKLRESYQKAYIEPYLESEPPSVEDSV